MSAESKVVESQYADPRTTSGGNPYQTHPERSSWVQWEVLERPDGSRYRREREASRWAGSFSYGDWVSWDLNEEGQRFRDQERMSRSAAAALSRLVHPSFMLVRNALSNVSLGEEVPSGRLLWPLQQALPAERRRDLGGLNINQAGRAELSTRARAVISFLSKHGLGEYTEQELVDWSDNPDFSRVVLPLLPNVSSVKWGVTSGGRYGWIVS